MSGTDPRARSSAERNARIANWLAQRASRDTGLFDRMCRWLLDRAMAVPPEDDWMRDDWVDNDMGYDADELERYQRGESSD